MQAYVVALSLLLLVAVIGGDPLACHSNTEQPMLPVFHTIGNVTSGTYYTGGLYHDGMDRDSILAGTRSQHRWGKIVARCMWAGPVNPLASRGQSSRLARQCFCIATLRQSPSSLRAVAS
jgi:hypothetical protein